jgi:hypothetical protein
VILKFCYVKLREHSGSWIHDSTIPATKAKKDFAMQKSFYFGNSLLLKLGFSSEEIDWIQTKQLER